MTTTQCAPTLAQAIDTMRPEFRRFQQIHKWLLDPATRYSDNYFSTIPFDITGIIASYFSDLRVQHDFPNLFDKIQTDYDNFIKKYRATNVQGMSTEQIFRHMLNQNQILCLEKLQKDFPDMQISSNDNNMHMIKLVNNKLIFARYPFSLYVGANILVVHPGKEIGTFIEHPDGNRIKMYAQNPEGAVIPLPCGLFAMIVHKPDTLYLVDPETGMAIQTRTELPDWFLINYIIDDFGNIGEFRGSSSALMLSEHCGSYLIETII